MDNPKIYLDELVLLKNIFDSNTSGISSPKLNSRIHKFGIILKNKDVFYKKIEKLRNLGLIESFRTNKIPPISKHTITKKGIEIIEEFNKKYYLEKEEKIIEKPKIITKTIVEYKELKELEPDELADLTQSVVYSLLEVIGKEYDKISKEKALKLEIIAEKIVKKVRDY